MFCSSKYKSSEYKSGDFKNIINYRPISLSLTIYKFFEKCIKKYRILKFENSNDFFSKSHFGFLNDESTNNTLFLFNQLIM